MHGWRHSLLLAVGRKLGLPALALTAFSLTAPTAALAAGAGSGASSVVGAREIVNTGLSLALIVAAIMALAWAYAKFQGGRSSGGVIEIVAAQPLGAKERIVVVAIGGEQMVVGVTAAGISKLKDLERPVEVQKLATLRSGFGERLRLAMKGAAR